MTRRYSRQGLWTLFLMCAFPLHAWTLLLAFRDLSWLTERTNAWDAVGVASYGLVFAFVESVIIFLLAALLGFLVSDGWEPERRIAVMSVLVLIASFWAIVSQLFFLFGVSLPGSVIYSLAQIPHPVRVLYAITFLIVAPTLLIPALMVLRSDKSYQATRSLIDRLSLLTTFYLLFDVAGLLIVIIRNLS
ncbi:MAG TPA: hypothetical protein VGJ22_07885 [Anaerolineales bacterium]|jgi:hypothetical protein